MGIDRIGLNALRVAHSHGSFGKTATLGRQNVHVPDRDLISIFGGLGGHEGSYCEQLLGEYFGAEEVVSIDSSAYEGASKVHDLNVPLPQDLVGKFDTVIDAGTLEHVFDVAQALKNTSLLVKPGGQIIHISPSDNFCGHGFWQFSPGLYFTLYSSKNGYKDTEVFVAELGSPDVWFRVREPIGSERIELIPKVPMFVIVRTVLERKTFSHESVNQSDYVFAWEDQTPRALNVKKARIPLYVRLGFRFLKNVAKSALVQSSWLRSILVEYSYREKRLSNNNPHLTRVKVSELLSNLP